MTDEIIISNKRWFKRYALVRGVLLVVVLAMFLLSILFNLGSSEPYKYLDFVALPLLIVILLFDFLQKPSFLEIQKSASGLTLRQYQPDARFFFFFQERRVNSRVLQEGEQLSYGYINGSLPMLNQIELYIASTGQAIEKTQKINVAWMKKEQFQKLDQYIEKI